MRITLYDILSMNYETFDRCAAETKKKWNKTDAYQEFEQKTQNLTAQQMQRTGDALMYIAGDSMTEIIDNAGCPGTAEFANQTIQIYTA